MSSFTFSNCSMMENSNQNSSSAQKIKGEEIAPELKSNGVVSEPSADDQKSAVLENEENESGGGTTTVYHGNGVGIPPENENGGGSTAELDSSGMGTPPENEKMDIFTDEEIHQIERTHEHFLLFNESGTLQRVSELSLAVLYLNHHGIVFRPQENLFYKYISQTGLWVPLTVIEMEKDVTDFSNYFFSSMGMYAAYHKLGHRVMRTVLEVLKSRVSDEKFFEKPEVEALYWIHFANCMTEFNFETKSWEIKPFSPKYRSRKRCEFDYDPHAEPTRFLSELIGPAMNEDDRDMLQRYAGQCLLGRNRSEKFLLMTGTPGGGKSTLVNVIRKIIGLHNCAELRLQHSNGRFEVSHYVGKTLLVGSDVPSDFLNRKGSERLKSYVGKDPLNFEYKCSSKFGEITGEFNVIITANTTLQVRQENDTEAYFRRTAWIRFENPPPATPIPDFDDLLVKTEGSGIINWMMDGAAKVILDDGRITLLPTQKARVKMLLEETDPVNIFVRDYIVKDEESDMTMKDLWNNFNSIREGRDLPSLKRAAFTRLVTDAIEVRYNCMVRHDISRAGGLQRGFRGIKFQPFAKVQ